MIRKLLHIDATPIASIRRLEAQHVHYRRPDCGEMSAIGFGRGQEQAYIPPRFKFQLSLYGSFHPPSFSGVLSHSRIKCRLGLPVEEA